MTLQELREFLKKNSPDQRGVGCFPCKLILEDLDKHGKLTGYPIDFNGAPEFPVQGKQAHLALELPGIKIIL